MAKTQENNIRNILFRDDIIEASKPFVAPKRVVTRVAMCTKCEHAYEVKEIEGYIVPDDFNCPSCGVENWDKKSAKYQGVNVLIYINWDYHKEYSPRSKKKKTEAIEETNP